MKNQDAIGVCSETFTFSDVTNIWNLNKEAWTYISFEASKREKAHVLKNYDPELANGHLYSINQKIYAFWNGYFILVLDRFL